MSTDMFETEICSRCGGSGTYSRTAMWGTTCFKCGRIPHVPGSGRVLTARGAAAQASFIASMSKPARDVTVGDRVLFRSTWGTVTRLETPGRNDDGSIRGSCDYGSEEVNARHVTIYTNNTAWTTSLDELVRVAQTPEEKARKLADALAYQSTLTKTGKPRKRIAARCRSEILP